MPSSRGLVALMRSSCPLYGDGPGSTPGLTSLRGSPIRPVRRERVPPCHLREVTITVGTNVQSFAVANLRRRPVVVQIGGFVAGFDVDWGRLSACGKRASVLTSAVVDDIEVITMHQRRLYHELTSIQMLVPVDGHLGLLLSHLEMPAPDRLRRRVASAAGKAAGFSAWIWFDLGDHFKMGHRYDTALNALGEAGDRGLRSYISAYQAVTADAAGRADCLRWCWPIWTGPFGSSPRPASLWIRPSSADQSVCGS
jgi:hypothetical protein